VLAAGLGAGIALNFTPVGLFLNIAMAVAASLLFLGLLLVKIVVSISTILVFVGMPLAAVIWPVVPWVARLALRAFAVCLIVPVAWALCFAGSAAVSLNAITFNAGTMMNTLPQPLVAIVLLYVTVKLPMHLARVAMLGAAPLGGGFASRAVGYAAGSQIRDSAMQHLPSWAGGQSAQTPQGESGAGRRLRNAATLAGAAATGGPRAAAAMAGVRPSTAGAGTGGATGAAGAGAASAGNGRAYSPPPTAQAGASGQGLQTGLQTPSFAGREQDFANEKFEAQFRERTNPVSAEQAKAALASLPEDTQHGIGQLVADHGVGAREHLAYQAMGEWSAEEREALRTLAAASPDIRAQAVDEALGGTSHGSGDASGDVFGASDTSDGAHDMPEGHTQPGWSDVDTAGGPPPRGTPSGPAADRPAGVGETAASAGGPGAPASGSQPPTPRETRGPNPGERFPNGSEV
jgi:hypothetical protein